MSEYITKPYEDKGQSTNMYLICPQKESGFKILCDSKSSAHKLSLSLMLGTTPSPSQAPEIYDYINTVDEVRFFTPKAVALGIETEDDSINDCCQSGCSGCPFYRHNT